MARDLQLLNEKELFEKTKKIAEFIRNADITLNYTRGDNWCAYNGTDDKWKEQYMVNLATPTIKGIPKYVALLHELGHIIYETPFTQVKKLMKYWADTSVNSEYNNRSNSFYFSVYNVLEDQRMESHLVKGYLSYQKKFNKCLNGLGSGLDSNLNYTNPFNALLAIRFRREDLVEEYKYKNEMKKAIQDVDQTDKYGALKVLVILKPILDEFLNEKKTDFSSTHDNSTKRSIFLPPTLNASSKEEYETEKRDLMSGEVKATYGDKDRDVGTSEEEYIESISDMDEDFKGVLIERKSWESSGVSDEQKDEIVGQAKELGEELQQDVQEQLLGTTTDKTPPSVKLIERKGKAEPAINTNILNDLKKLFKYLKMGQKGFVDYQGTDIDVDAYISNYIKGVDLSKSYRNTKTHYGASVVVSIDASTSMRGNRITIARNLMATLFESVKGLNNIELKANVWSSSRKGIIGIQEINNKRDCRFIDISEQYPYTPTHMALEYSARMLKELRGKKKLLIIITDGYPNYNKDDRRMSLDRYQEMCKKSLKKVLKVTPNVMFVTIAEKPWVFDIMEKIFGKKRIIRVPNMANGAEKVISNFRRIILRTFE
jgi:hypothetical protein